MNYPCELVKWVSGEWKSERAFETLAQGFEFAAEQFPQGYAHWRQTWGGWALPLYSGKLHDGSHAYGDYALRMTEEDYVRMATEGK